MVADMVESYIIVDKDNEIVGSFQTLGGEHNVKAPEGCKILRESEYVPNKPKSLWDKVFRN